MPAAALRWTLRHRAVAGLPDTHGLVLRAVMAGRLETVRCLLEHVFPGFADVRGDPIYALTAAEMGFLAVLQYLRESHQCAWDHRIVWYSLTNHHVDVARWAILTGCPLVPPSEDQDVRALQDMLLQEILV